MNSEHYELSQKVGQVLKHKGWKIVTAESCTGGWVAEMITAISGSSQWFDRGFVTYSNEAKMEMLGVKQSTLDQYGAVSKETAIEMAAGALKNSQAQISIAITGIAGPEGGTPDKPLGTVWFAWASKEGRIHSQCMKFNGDRQSIRLQAVIFALTYISQAWN